jgi:hypothetical protein
MLIISILDELKELQILSGLYLFKLAKSLLGHCTSYK